MYNAANVKQVKKAASRANFNRKLELDDLRFVLSSKPGRRLIWRYLIDCGVFKSSFTGSSETFFLEGSRNIGLKILCEINESDPEKYVLMLKEAKEQENAGRDNSDANRNTESDGVDRDEEHSDH